MGKRKITSEMIETIKDMMTGYSNSEIAEHLHISIGSVKNIISEYKLGRSKEDKFNIRSRVRKNLIRAEKRRTLFGLEQKTSLKVFSNPERLRLRRYFRRLNYIIRSRGAMTICYDDSTKRSSVFEERGRKVGLTFMKLESQQPINTSI